MTPSRSSAELFELLEAFCRGEIRAEQQARLDELVCADETLRRAYLEYLHMHVCLRQAFGKIPGNDQPGLENRGETCPGTETARPAVVAAAAPRWPYFRQWWPVHLAALMAASILLAVGLLAIRRPAASRPAAAVQVPLGTLTNAAGCRWETPAPLQAGDRVWPGRYALAMGMAEFTLTSGAVILLEAPSDFELVSPSRGVLRSGRMVARVPGPATGLVVETPSANIEDLGTEFGLGIDQAGTTTVQVFDGTVVAERKDGAGSRRLVAGQALEIEAQSANPPRDLVFDEQRFVRCIPPEQKRSRDGLVPYGLSRYDAMHIVPAPGAVVIDGDLGEWDRSGEIHGNCFEPYAAVYYFRGCMMYDRTNLYIGAHVGDPFPLRSVINPDTDPRIGWRGGGVQVRLTTDPALGWPLQGETPTLKRYGKRPDDLHRGLVHVDMWYYRPRRRPCLHLEYSMNYQGALTNPEGAAGAFRVDADGRGYVLEYAIPWKLLHPTGRVPQPGDPLGVCWEVHWSGEDGRLRQGYLSEVLNPREKGDTHGRAATWGRAIYHRNGHLPAGTVVPRNESD